MPLAERYWHWQQAPEEELLDYIPEQWLTADPADDADEASCPPSVSPCEEDPWED